MPKMKDDNSGLTQLSLYRTLGGAKFFMVSRPLKCYTEKYYI